MDRNKSETAIGIDLGTTNCCVAVCKNGLVDVIPNRLGDFVTPSWVAFKDEEIIIGKIAKENAHRNVRGTVCGIKRIIGRNYNDSVVQEAKRNWLFEIKPDDSGRPTIEIQHKTTHKCVYPEEVSANILRQLKEDAEAFLGEENLTDVVITVPAYFNDHQRQATKDAATIAGLNVLRLINEPTAAAVSYVFDKPEKQERNVLVYDLGGGTFDVSIISLKDRDVKVKATLGDTNLGGENFDQNCVDYFVESIIQKYGASGDHATKPAFLARLKHQVEKGKHTLSSTFATAIDIPLFDGTNDVDEEFTRARFDELNNDFFEDTMKIVDQCIKEAGLKNEDIDDVVLIGGSTRIIKIEEMLKEVFGHAVSKAANPDQAVARGAAVLAASLNGTLPNPLNILDVLPMPLGIETLGGKMNTIIERNSQIPTEAMRTFTTGVDGQDGIEITILEGDSLTANENLELGRFILMNLPEHPSVEVTFQVDMNGILTVAAIETSSGIGKTVNVTLHKGGLTETEIGELSRNSVYISEESKKHAAVSSKRNQLESYLLQVKSNAKRISGRMSSRDQELLTNRIETSLSWMKTEAAKQANKVGHEFENVKRYSEKIMRKYV